MMSCKCWKSSSWYSAYQGWSIKIGFRMKSENGWNQEQSVYRPPHIRRSQNKTILIKKRFKTTLNWKQWTPECYTINRHFWTVSSPKVTHRGLPRWPSQQDTRWILGTWLDEVKLLRYLQWAQDVTAAFMKCRYRLRETPNYLLHCGPAHARNTVHYSSREPRCEAATVENSKQVQPEKLISQKQSSAQQN